MFGYVFLKKTPELVAQRRLALDWYANVAQISQLVLHLVVIPLCSSAASVRPKKKPGEQDDRQSLPAALNRTARNIFQTLNSEIARGWGTYGQWVFGTVWTCWLLFLCFADTAPDYLHLTKRFGLIAVSQLPIHYLLSSAHHHPTLQSLLRTSSTLNLALHKVTGRIILTFFALHVSLFTYFFAANGILWSSVSQPYIVAAGIAAAVLAVLGVTSTGLVRRRRYRLFWRVHVGASAVVLGLLWFHGEGFRVYLVESAGLVLGNAVVRVRGRAK